MAWPTTGAGSVASGYVATGVTTICWGSRELVTSINGVAVNGVTVGIVTKFSEKAMIENIKLPNGDGLTTTRVSIMDGMQWDVTIRDDIGLTGRPRAGTTVVIRDAGGLVGTIGLKYAATVVDNGYEAAPKQTGEISISLEALNLIEGYIPVA